MIDNNIKNTIKLPTSLIVNGMGELGVELAASLIEQGGYVIVVDVVDEANQQKLLERFDNTQQISFLDYARIPDLDQDLRRLDYTFYLQNEVQDPTATISTQRFLRQANYLDTILAITTKFEAQFLLASSMRAAYEIMQLDADLVRSRKDNNYRQLDIQKYAESLTLEYAEKADLASRVIRVGEIIGDGLDLSKDNVFNKLIVQAVKGENLTLPGDGLDSEYYVHVLDAVYGIIKSQFTPATIGEVFTAAYETPITHLSIAYRLQELEPRANDIDFRKDLKSNSKIKLKRTAPSLTQLGWRPRIDLDQAITESIITAKSIRLDETLSGQNKDQDGFLGKLSSFLNIAQISAEEALESDQTGDGPVSRLIAERQRYDRVRNKSINRADDYIRNKYSRQLSFREKINNFLWRQFKFIQSRFGFLSEVTPIQFLSYAAVFIFIGVFYFGALSPILVIARNSVIGVDQVNAVKESIENNDFKQLSDLSTDLVSRTSENDEMIEWLKPIASLVYAEELLAEVEELNETYAQLSSGLADLSYALSPFANYLESYTNNIRYRANPDNYVALGNTISYAQFLDQMSQRRAFANNGEIKLSSAADTLQNLNPRLPIRDEILEFNTSLRSQALQLSALRDLAIYAPDFLASEAQHRYLVFILDDTRPMPIGGDLASVIEIVVEEGAIISASVKSVDNLNIDSSSIPSFTTQLNPVNSDINNLTELAYIPNIDDFQNSIALTWQDYYGKEVDLVGVMTLSGLERLLPTNANESITIEGVQFTNSGLLDKLNSVQGDAGLERRRDIITQITGQWFVSTVSSIDINLVDNLRDLSGLVQNEEFKISSNDPNIYQLTVQNNLGGDVALRQADLLLSPMFIRDSRVVDANRYPAATQSTSIEVAEENISFEYVLRFAGQSNLSRVVVCLPSGSQDLQVANLSSERYQVNSVLGVTCINADASASDEVVLRWQVPQFARNQESNYNLSIGFDKPTGINLTSNVEVSVDSELELLEITPQVAITSGRAGLTQDLGQDQIITLTLNN